MELEELASADAEKVTINAQRKLKKLKYRLEVGGDNEQPQRYRGYQDETYQASGEGGGANYAIMIFDVSVDCIISSFISGQEQSVQACTGREALQV